MRRTFSEVPFPNLPLDGEPLLVLSIGFYGGWPALDWSNGTVEGGREVHVDWLDVVDYVQRHPSLFRVSAARDEVPQGAKPTQGGDLSPREGCYAWLVAEMRRSPGRSDQIKSDWREDAKKRFPGLEDPDFDWAWTTACKEEDSGWDKPGRRPGR